MKCYENKWRSSGLVHLHGAWRDVLFVLVWLPYTFTSCFPSNTVVNYWCYHHVCLPPSLPPPVPYTPAPLQGSPSFTESPKNRLHTIPVTISNKAEQGEGRDAPWHLNQLLSNNNSMIFNPSLLSSSLQCLEHHGCFYHSREKQQNESLHICSGISVQIAKMES